MAACFRRSQPPVRLTTRAPHNRSMGAPNGAGEGRQWSKAIVVCRVSEITSQVKVPPKNHRAPKNQRAKISL